MPHQKKEKKKNEMLSISFKYNTTFYQFFAFFLFFFLFFVSSLSLSFLLLLAITGLLRNVGPPNIIKKNK
jgi:hypothetical protein